MITVGGADDQQSVETGGSGPRPRGALLGAVGLAVGLAMGAVFAGGDSESTVTTTTLPEEVIAPSVSITTTTTAPPRPSRLATRAPGLSDNLVITAVDAAGVTGVDLWEPADISPGPANLPVARFLASDSSRQWLGAFTDTRYQALGNLWVGNSRYLETVALDVTGFAWHSRLPARIAYTSGRDGQTLWTAQLPNATPTLVTEVAENEVPVWFTQSGVVLFDETNLSLRLVSDTGETLSVIESSVRPVAGSAEVLAAIDTSGETPQAVVLDRSLNPVVDAPWSADCLFGSFSPAPSGALALLCSVPTGQVLQVWGATGADPSEPPLFELMVEIPATGFHPPAWDSVGRIVVGIDVDPIRPNTQILVYDTLTDSRYRLDYAGSVIDLAVVVP